MAECKASRLEALSSIPSAKKGEKKTEQKKFSEIRHDGILLDELIVRRSYLLNRNPLTQIYGQVLSYNLLI